MPAGVWESTLPGEEYTPELWEMLRRCKCGCWLKLEPERTEPWEDSYICDDARYGEVGKKVIMAAGWSEYRTCTRCDSECVEHIA